MKTLLGLAGIAFMTLATPASLVRIEGKNQIADFDLFDGLPGAVRHEDRRAGDEAF